MQTKKLENAKIPPVIEETPAPRKKIFDPTATQDPSAEPTVSPKGEGEQAADNPKTDQSGADTQITKPQTAPTKTKKQSRPVISLKKKGSGKQRYLRVTVKSTTGRYFDLYMKKKGKKYVRIRLKKAKLKNGRKVVKLKYTKKGYIVCFKVRVYDKTKGRKRYRAYSKEKRIKL